jgi:hypothetical protein
MNPQEDKVEFSHGMDVSLYPGHDGSMAFEFVLNDCRVYMDVGPGRAVHLHYTKSDGTPSEFVISADDDRVDGFLSEAFSTLVAKTEI